MRLYYTWIFCFIATPIGLSIAGQPVAQPAGQPLTLQQDHSINISAPDALFEAISDFRNLFPVPINFEEAPFQAPKDLTVVHLGPRLQVVSVRRGTLQATCLEGDDARTCMERVLAEYHNAGLPGTYSVSEADGEVSVIPIAVAAASGRDVKVSPIMAAKMSFPETERNLYRFIEFLAAQVGAVSHTTVLIGTIPYTDNNFTTLGASGESGSEILAKLGASAGPQAYSVMYDPDGKAYYLSLSPPPPGLTRQAASRLGTVSATSSQRVSPFFTKTQ